MKIGRNTRQWVGLLILTAGLVAHWSGILPAEQGQQFAYIGPGAGFAFLGSFLGLLSGFALTALSILSWPFRMVRRSLRRRQGFSKAHAKKVIFLGLDGLDPKLTERYLEEGKLPNLARLRETGSYTRLRTTFPSLSPVAWSTFATGVHPAKHNIFDFLNRNTKSYVPELSSAKVGRPRRTIKIGSWTIPLSSPSVELRRKSQPFWKILGEQYISSTIIRVPITFPPEKFNGRLLSAMSTPDLRGTQGSFSHFSTKLQKATYEGGSRYPLQRKGNKIEGSLEGPDHPFEAGPPLAVKFELKLTGKDSCTLSIEGKDYRLTRGDYSPWIKLTFQAPLGARVTGIVRFMLTETEPEVTLYATPVQLDPESPALPISHPSYYASYLAKLLGTYSTLGMAEDTWALNEGVIDEEAFLKQAYLTMAEREAMFVNALEKTRHGVVACVFDTSDRVQHMFWRFLEGKGEDEKQTRYAKTIEDLYQRMDRLVGLAQQHVDEDTILFVLSDHGFCSFRRGFNLNSWLHQNGYLTLKDGTTESGPTFQGVDWSRTRAYTLGLGGLYLNIKGREAEGIVKSGAEAERLKRELIEKLADLRDEATGEIAIRQVYATNALYKGPYLTAAPDLIVGYNEGYRTSWDAAVGKVSASVYEDNCKAWSGDHCVDPHLVPGVLFCNRKVDAQDPGIEDLAPTTLKVFGVQPPTWMDGKQIFNLA
jgi:predicted AlkP superfamily phosphohydrolase/phosphomutase